MRNPSKVSKVTMSLVAAALLLVAGAGCSGGPTGEDIENSLEETLRSAAGDWVGTSTGATPAVTLAFRLVEGGNGQVSGTGTMREGSGAAVPITVSGTYRRPALALTFTGIVYEGRAVQGTAQGQYTTAAGVATTLQLSGTDYARSIPVLLQEN